MTDPIVYPPDDTLLNAELFLPLGDAGQRRYDQIWKRFLPEEGGAP